MFLRSLFLTVACCLLLPAAAADKTTDDTAAADQELQDIEVTYLGKNEGHDHSDQEILVLQLVNAEQHAAFDNEQLLLCLARPEDAAGMHIDRRYRVSLRQTDEDSAVSWMLGEVLPLVESTDETGDEVTQEEAEHIHEQAPTLPSAIQQQATARLLDGGSSWLLMHTGGARLQLGDAALHLPSLEMTLTVTITASDGRFFICAGKQLQHLRLKADVLSGLQISQ